MNTEEMLQEVDRRVADGLVEHLLPKAVERHGRSRKQYRSCDCNYCRTKAIATRDIAWLNFPRDYKPVSYSANPDYDFWEIKTLRRKHLREHYRNKLKELINE